MGHRNRDCIDTVAQCFNPRNFARICRSQYRPDGLVARLVRQTRKIERRLALEPDLRPVFAPNITQDLPLIATTAEQYVALAGQELPAAQNERMIVAEGVLREAGDRLERLLNNDGHIDAPVVGLIRMDTNAEVLAERLSADTADAAKRANAARLSHALRQASRGAEDAKRSLMQQICIPTTHQTYIKKRCERKFENFSDISLNLTARWRETWSDEERPLRKAAPHIG